MDEKSYPLIVWDIIIYPCFNFNGEKNTDVKVRAWMSNYFTLFQMDAMTYPYPNWMLV